MDGQPQEASGQVTKEEIEYPNHILRGLVPFVCGLLTGTWVLMFLLPLSAAFGILAIMTGRSCLRISTSRGVRTLAKVGMGITWLNATLVALLLLVGT